MDKINTYDQLVARFPWLNEQLAHNPQLAALMLFNLGISYGVDYVLGKTSVAKDMDDWERAYQPSGKTRDA